MPRLTVCSRRSRSSWRCEGRLARSTAAIPVTKMPSNVPAPPIDTIGAFSSINLVKFSRSAVARLDRRELVWLDVTTHPTAEWIAQQITEAFPWCEAPLYLIRDNDALYGSAFRRRLRAMGIRDRPIADGSPWQNGIVERLIGSIRRECLITFSSSARLICGGSCARYYNSARAHRF